MRLGEADRIITLYTPDRGKVRAVVKGARRTRSRKGGFLQPLTHVRVSIAEGRSLDQVVEAETEASFRAVREDLSLVSIGLYLAELVDAFSADGAVNPSEFRLLVGALGALESTERPDQLARYFETRLLSVAGFGPEVRQCVDCGEELSAGDHAFSCAGGGLVGPECRSRTHGALIHVSMNAIKVLRFFQVSDFLTGPRTAAYRAVDRRPATSFGYLHHLHLGARTAQRGVHAPGIIPLESCRGR